jgi:hypothetical protein
MSTSFASMQCSWLQPSSGSSRSESVDSVDALGTNPSVKWWVNLLAGHVDAIS